jgi:hypothetical protein
MERAEFEKLIEKSLSSLENSEDDKRLVIVLLGGYLTIPIDYSCLEFDPPYPLDGTLLRIGDGEDAAIIDIAAITRKDIKTVATVRKIHRRLYEKVK